MSIHGSDDFPEQPERLEETIDQPEDLRVPQELVDEELSGFDLENIEVDWNEVTAVENEPGNWTFTVPDQFTGRKIGYLVSSGYPETHRNATRWLSDPSPAVDIRFGGQTSFVEYDEDFGNRGPIVSVNLFRRLSHPGDYGFLPEFEKAMEPVLTKVRNKKTFGEK